MYGNPHPPRAPAASCRQKHASRACWCRLLTILGDRGSAVCSSLAHSCGEYYFGGLPVWLRNMDDIKCFRCRCVRSAHSCMCRRRPSVSLASPTCLVCGRSDPVWKREMARWVGVVVEQIRPTLASNGGNVVMLQIENEYNGAAASCYCATSSVFRVPRRGRSCRIGEHCRLLRAGGTAGMRTCRRGPGVLAVVRGHGYESHAL